MDSVFIEGVFKRGALAVGSKENRDIACGYPTADLCRNTLCDACGFGSVVGLFVKRGCHSPATLWLKNHTVPAGVGEHLVRCLNDGRCGPVVTH